MCPWSAWPAPSRGAGAPGHRRSGAAAPGCQCSSYSCPANRACWRSTCAPRAARRARRSPSSARRPSGGWSCPTRPGLRAAVAPAQLGVGAHAVAEHQLPVMGGQVGRGASVGQHAAVVLERQAVAGWSEADVGNDAERRPRRRTTARDPGQQRQRQRHAESGDDPRRSHPGRPLALIDAFPGSGHSPPDVFADGRPGSGCHLPRSLDRGGGLPLTGRLAPSGPGTWSLVRERYPGVSGVFRCFLAVLGALSGIF